MDSQCKVASGAHLRRIRGEACDNDPWDRPGAFRAATAKRCPAVAESSCFDALISSGVDSLRLVRTAARRAILLFFRLRCRIHVKILGYFSLLIITDISFKNQRISGGRNIFSLGKFKCHFPLGFGRYADGFAVTLEIRLKRPCIPGISQFWRYYYIFHSIVGIIGNHQCPLLGFSCLVYRHLVVLGCNGQFRHCRLRLLGRHRRYCHQDRNKYS